MDKSLLVAAAFVAAGVGPVAAQGTPTITYIQNSLVESKIHGGPWTLHKVGGPHAHDASGIIPTTPGPPYPPSVSGVPYAGLCNAQGKFTRNHGLSVMQPYYFPFVRELRSEFRDPDDREHREGMEHRGDREHRHDDGGDRVLEGFFDYRPRNQQEATVAAISTDWGATWHFRGEALALNPYCPWDPTDPDNLSVNIGGVETPYGSVSSNAGDNGLGHPVVLSVNGVERIYNLNRASGFIDSDQLVVHELRDVPEFGYVSPLTSDGYPDLDPTATKTTGLVTPDAFMGAVKMGETTTVVYVAKALNADTELGYPACPETPSYALTNLVNGKPRKPNHDVTTVHVATTTDGINFTDIGAASGLNDPETTALDGIRYLGSGSILKLANGHYGMFFGAGNCLDNDSDGFHFVGYAETTNPVEGPSDLLSWQIIYGLDNPILSTDTVTNADVSPARSYPANPPVVDAQGVDALTPTQVAPFEPVPGGYNSNFFSGRVYDPQAVRMGRDKVTIVFAGYNTPQPSNNLGDYRTIGRFQLQFPHGYLAR